jgi:hypothetical protein
MIECRTPIILIMNLRVANIKELCWIRDSSSGNYEELIHTQPVSYYL